MFFVHMNEMFCVFFHVIIIIIIFFIQQLHSSVRTGNLETCLRLLSLGAQANFFHPVSSLRASSH